MTTAIRHDHSALQFFKSATASILALSPSVVAGMYLMDNRASLYPPYQIIYLILLLAVLDIAAIVLLQPYRRYLSKLTPPALAGAVTIVLLYIIAESVNRFFERFGYSFLTPFVVACLALIYITVFLEKNIALKFYLSLNSIAVMFLWAMGSVDRVAMPF